MRGDAPYLYTIPINKGVLVGLLSQIKCINLWAPVAIDLKSYSEKTKD